MARSLFDLRNAFSSIKNDAASKKNPLLTSNANADAELPDDDSASICAGFFESSWDLQAGLDVHEIPAGDAAFNAWLGVWAASAIPRFNPETAAPDEAPDFTIDGIEFV